MPKKKSSATKQKSASKQVTKTTKKPPEKAVKNNVSKKVPNGRTIKTQDKYLPIAKKGNSAKPKNKRIVAVIDSNAADELAVVRLTTQKQANTTELPTYKKGNKKKTLFKHFVEITDNEGKPIKIDGIKFIENGKEYDLSVSELRKVSEHVLKHTAQAEENKKKIAKLKSRRNKKR